MVKLFALLGAALRPFLHRLQPIMLMDAALGHLTPNVVCAAAQASIWLLQVPARLTWLLQPCDTHFFRAYKRRLEAELCELRQQAGGGDVTNDAWIEGISEAAVVFLSSRSWRPAFEQTGVTEGAPLSEALQSFPPPRPTWPTAEGLRSLFPRRRRLDLNSYFAPVFAANRARQQARLRAGN